MRFSKLRFAAANGTCAVAVLILCLGTLARWADFGTSGRRNPTKHGWVAGFRDRRIQPLCHLSGYEGIVPGLAAVVNFPVEFAVNLFEENRRAASRIPGSHVEASIEPGAGRSGAPSVTFQNAPTEKVQQVHSFGRNGHIITLDRLPADV